MFKIHGEWVSMVKGIIAKFLGKLWNESQSSTTVSIRLDVWVKEKDNAFLTALQFMNTRISMRWTCVGGWNALQAALVCTITRDAAWENHFTPNKPTMKQWKSGKVQSQHVTAHWSLRWHNSAVIRQISVKATVAYNERVRGRGGRPEIMSNQNQWPTMAAS